MARTETPLIVVMRDLGFIDYSDTDRGNDQQWPVQRGPCTTSFDDISSNRNPAMPAGGSWSFRSCGGSGMFQGRSVPQATAGGQELIPLELCVPGSCCKAPIFLLPSSAMLILNNWKCLSCHSQSGGEGRNRHETNWKEVGVGLQNQLKKRCGAPET
jgi:hypothetical protein